MSSKINGLSAHPRTQAVSAPPDTSCVRTLSKTVTRMSRNGISKSMNGNQLSAPPDMGQTAYRPGHWVQTERAAHEAWARFCLQNQTAAAVLHVLVANMGHQNAVLVPQKVLAGITGLCDRTIRRAITALAKERWIQVVRIGKGKEAAYVVNDRVAWGQARGQMRLSLFSAAVIADADDQAPATLDQTPLRKLAVLMPGERQLPAGPGEPPPSQPTFDGMEPDLPALSADPPREVSSDQADRETLEAQSQTRPRDHAPVARLTTRQTAGPRPLADLLKGRTPNTAED